MEPTHLTITIIEIVSTAIAAIAASSGFWAYMTVKRNNNSLNRQLLIGLAHDRIINLCLKYIRRGWITQDEHENLYVFLYNPYEQMGGNGSAKRLIDEVNKLPIKFIPFEQLILKENAPNDKQQGV